MTSSSVVLCCSVSGGSLPLRRSGGIIVEGLCKGPSNIVENKVGRKRVVTDWSHELIGLNRTIRNPDVGYASIANFIRLLKPPREHARRTRGLRKSDDGRTEGPGKRAASGGKRSGMPDHDIRDCFHICMLHPVLVIIQISSNIAAGCFTYAPTHRIPSTIPQTPTLQNRKTFSKMWVSNHPRIHRHRY